MKESSNNTPPGYNCKKCGYKTCKEYKKVKATNCPFVRPIGVVVKERADFRLLPLPKEPSCREILLPLTSTKFKVDDIIRYRPIGCPITHYARIVNIQGSLIAVHIIGPLDRQDYVDVGHCLVIGFEGIVQGDIPRVCETVVFIPNYCMMGKCHAGIVVKAEGRKIRIELIDLKVYKR